ncbi:nucleotidyltransferase domain-containing protein [Candidatus Woesearchaeota archaeon]|nr:nucleotidyltransferase domain-containing protein [Candidatus Woesearchaeota archaeon]
MLKKLEKCLKPEKKDRSIFDIVIYGSAVKGKMIPNDIDILVIFHAGTLKERLDKIQTIKKKITLNRKIDIKAILLEELFQSQFFARSGVFLEGISVFDGKPFSHKIDFEGFTIFSYDLTEKTHTEKVKFNYLLSGRNAIGVIKQLEGNSLGSAVIQIPIKNSLEFEEVLQQHKINYTKKNVLVQR